MMSPEMNTVQAGESWSLEKLHVAVAIAACRADGNTPYTQVRALEAVCERFGYVGENFQELEGWAEDVVDRVTAARASLEPAQRVGLFATACWVAISDGRTHGMELSLLCDLRTALELAPDQARQALMVARKTRRGSDRPPGPAELEMVLIGSGM